MGCNISREMWPRFGIARTSVLIGLDRRSLRLAIAVITYHYSIRGRTITCVTDPQWPRLGFAKTSVIMGQVF